MGQKEKIIELIQSEVSIPKIAKILNINKSTIYYHYKKIKGKKYQKPTIPVDEQIVGEFLGIFAGDGSYHYEKKTCHYTIAIYLHAVDDKDYGDYVKNLIERNFNKKVRTYQSKNLLTLVFYSKDIYNFITQYLNIVPIKTYSVHLKNLESLSHDFLTAFVRGIFDTDGHHKYDGRLVICLASKPMIDQIALILNKLDIQNKIYVRNGPRQHYELNIPRREFSKYHKIIGFSNKRKECAGRDSNSRSF